MAQEFNEDELLNKITVGFVVQKYDPKTRKFVSQEFVASEDAEYEYFDGDGIGEDEVPEEMENSLPFLLVQP